MKKLFFILLISSIFFTACSSTSLHPIVKSRKELMATEVRINIYVSDDISQARVDNYPLKSGNNYIKVPVGTHILYWNKKGNNNSREVIVDSNENKFILF